MKKGSSPFSGSDGLLKPSRYWSLTPFHVSGPYSRCSRSDTSRDIFLHSRSLKRSGIQGKNHSSCLFFLAKRFRPGENVIG
jgi:hypothetical protein